MDGLSMMMGRSSVPFLGFAQPNGAAFNPPALPMTLHSSASVPQSNVDRNSLADLPTLPLFAPFASPARDSRLPPSLMVVQPEPDDEPARLEFALPHWRDPIEKEDEQPSTVASSLSKNRKNSSVDSTHRASSFSSSVSTSACTSTSTSIRKTTTSSRDSRNRSANAQRSEFRRSSHSTRSRGGSHSNQNHNTHHQSRQALSTSSTATMVTSATTAAAAAVAAAAADEDGGPGKLHRCGYCEKTFRKRYHLTRHIRLHTNERPYSCSACQMRFTRSDKRTTHERRVHGLEICRRNGEHNPILISRRDPGLNHGRMVMNRVDSRRGLGLVRSESGSASASSRTGQTSTAISVAFEMDY